MNLLSPLGWLYGLGATARNALYDRGLFRVHELGAKTISIGNITAGGTGKTPLVALVTKMLADRGEKVCILTRGYGRKNPAERVLVSNGESVLADAANGGDEPVELARILLGNSLVVADRERVAAAGWAQKKFGVTAFVLDDGFQHRRAKRSLDIVCIDATDPYGGGEVLPAGTLREPLRNLRRAGAFVITRSNLVSSNGDIIAKLQRFNPSAPIFEASTRISSISKLNDFLALSSTPEISAEMSSVSNGFLFCGLGNPASLRDQLANENVDLAGFRDFADHHVYSQNDIEQLESDAERVGAKLLLTTGKDAVKLTGLNFRLPCYVLTSSTTISDPEHFKKLVTSSL